MAKEHKKEQRPPGRRPADELAGGLPHTASESEGEYHPDLADCAHTALIALRTEWNANRQVRTERIDYAIKSLAQGLEGEAPE